MAAQHDSHLTLDDVFWLMYHHEVPGVGKLKLIRCRLETCAECRTACPGLLELMDSGQLPEDLGFYDLHLFYSAQEAGKVWATLEGSGPELLRRRLQVESATYGLVALLAEEAHQQASIDVDRALLLGEAALEMAHRLKVLPQRTVDGFDYRCLEAEARTEMLGWCHGVLANAQRKHLRYLEAERNFQKALALLEEVDQPLFLATARVLSMRASLLMDIRLLDEAIDCLADARWALHGGHPDAGRLEAEIAINQSLVLGLANRDTEALHAIEEVVRKREVIPPRLRLFLQHRLCEQQLLSGDASGCHDELPFLRDLCADYGKGLDQVRVEWLEARLQAAMGGLESALAGLRTLLEHCISARAADMAALLALEVAAILLALKRSDEAREHASRAFTLLSALQLKAESLGALTLLVVAAKQGRLNEALIRSLLRYAQGGPSPGREAWAW
jgi:tetratricopeptide (TPR) repeat protein